MLLDIAPTLAMYENTTEAFARAYWHWFALIQPAPMPESLIDNNPARYVRDVMGGRFAGLAPFSPGAMAEYERCALIPEPVPLSVKITVPVRALIWNMTASTWPAEIDLFSPFEFFGVSKVL